MRIGRTLAAAFLTLGLTATLTPAHAEPTPPDSTDCILSNVQLSDSELAMGVRETATVDVVATATGCEDSWDAWLSFNSSVATFLTASEDPTVWTGSLGVDTRYLDNDEAGPTRGTLDYGDGRVVSSGATLTLRREAVLMSWAPSTVKKNKRFDLNATLMRADWDKDWYDTANGKTLRLQSRTNGGKWKTIRTLRTNGGKYDGGSAQYRTKITKNTCLRWAFDGSSASSASSSSNCVKIKK